MIKATDPRYFRDMIRAAAREIPVTVTYTAASGTETVRTIEPYAVETTKKGDRIIRAMDRETGEHRTWRMDRVTAYTLHRGASFQVKRPTSRTDVELPAAPAYPATDPAPYADSFETDWDAAWGAWLEQTYNSEMED